MSKFSTAIVIIGLGSLSIVTSGCAGELTDAQKETREGGLGTGGSGGSGGGGAGGGGGSGGSAGSGVGNPEVCMMAMTKEKSCNVVGCHAGNNPAAKLLLTDEALRLAKDNFVDKPNNGNMPGCGAGVQKLIDKAQPEKSLMYTKLLAQPPCGERMPNGGSLSDAQMSCVLAWINSVARSP